MNHDVLRENIPAYILGVLDLGEEAALRRHLANCPACAEEITAYAAIPDALNVAVPTATLPSGFNTRLLERAVPIRALPDPAVPAVRPRDRSHPARLPWTVAAACLVLALALGGWNWQLNTALDQQEQELAQRRSTVAGVVDLLGRPGVIVRDAGVSEDGTRTRLYLAREGDLAMVVFDKMPPPPQGRVYQLWLGGEGETESVATFTPNASGHWFRLLNPAGGVRAYETVGVSLEPEGGSQKPTTRWAIWERL
ncbi:MAG: anti-sigma factor [Chloroflexota bacterium]|nr:anti-sigma factor [Chloroflexota bacterium]